MNARVQTENKPRVPLVDVLALWRADTSEAKAEFLKAIELKQYVPLHDKRVIADLSLKLAHTERNDETNPNAITAYRKDSVQEYILNVMAILRCYTIIAIEDGSSVVYDMMQEQGIIQFILKAIGDDLAEWTRIWNLAREDFMEEHFSMFGFVRDKWERFGIRIRQFGKKLGKVADKATEALKDEELMGSLVDADTITERIGLILGAIQDVPSEVESDDEN